MENDSSRILGQLKRTTQELADSWPDKTGLEVSRCFLQSTEEARRIGSKTEELLSRAQKIRRICLSVLGEEDGNPVKKLVR